MSDRKPKKADGCDLREEDCDLMLKVTSACTVQPRTLSQITNVSTELNQKPLCGRFPHFQQRPASVYPKLVCQNSDSPASSFDLSSMTEHSLRADDFVNIRPKKALIAAWIRESQPFSRKQEEVTENVPEHGLIEKLDDLDRPLKERVTVQLSLTSKSPRYQAARVMKIATPCLRKIWPEETCLLTIDTTSKRSACTRAGRSSKRSRLEMIPFNIQL